MYKRLLSSVLIIMLLLSAWSPISVQASDGINDIRGHLISEYRRTAAILRWSWKRQKRQLSLKPRR